MDKGSRIKSAREAAGLTQEELGLLCGTTKQTIFKYENNIVTNIPTDRMEKIAEILNVTPAYLMGWEGLALESIVEDNKSGRTAAVEELRRTYGTEHSIHSTYSCDDKKRATLLYYKTLERDVALSLTDIISTVDHLDGRQAEKVTLLLHAYLKAEQPIRNIVDTALDPYVEDLDDLLCGGSRIG